jgi:hypothetical protein
MKELVLELVKREFLLGQFVPFHLYNNFFPWLSVALYEPAYGVVPGRTLIDKEPFYPVLDIGGFQF